MSVIKENLQYTQTHEWVRKEEDGTYTVGITDHAQEMMGDLVFLELPEIDSEVTAGQPCCVSESVKAASDINAPLSGKIIKVNAALELSPEVVNKDPYGKGWFFQLEPSDIKELDDLLSNTQYEELLEELH